MAAGREVRCVYRCVALSCTAALVAPAPVLAGGRLPDRRYTDKEVSLILQRAVESVDRTAPEHVGADGLSLEQIREVAREVGIDPDRVDSAALTLDLQPSNMTRGFLGAPATVQYERVLPFEVPREAYPEVVATIRRVLHRQGIVTEELGALEWRARDAAGSRYVSVQPGDGRTVVRVMGNYRDGAIAYYVVGGALGGLAGVATFAGLAELIDAGAILLAMGMATLPPWITWRRKFRRETESLRELVARIETHLIEGRE